MENELADTIARRHTADAMQALVDVMHQKPRIETTDDGDSILVEGANASARVAAAKEILARGHGMPTQAIITMPANPRRSEQLAAMSDSALLAAIGAARIARQAEDATLLEGTATDITPMSETDALADPLCA